MRLCSACLLGVKCRYDGKSNIENASPRLLKEFHEGKLIPVCPEQLGGLATPRSGARISKGDGNNVLDDGSKLITDEVNDVTEQYLKGAYETLRIAKELRIDEVILKQESPSCGCGYIQGGLDKRETIKGDGVTTALLKRNKINILTEEDVK